MNEGKKDRRDPIRTIKAKNPVAKNATAAIGGGAAGAHKDKKKAAKAGEVKHKKQEYAEHLESMLATAVTESRACPVCGQTPCNCTHIAEGGYDYHRPDPAWVTINGKRWKWFFNYVSARKAMDTLNAKFRKEGSNKKADWEPADLEDNPDYGIKIGEAANGITGPGMMDTRPSEGTAYDQGEYDDEAGMAQGNLHTIAMAAKGLLDTIDDQDNLPEWAQEKIAKVEGMLVTVWNYLQSQKSQGIDPKVSEAQSALAQHRQRSAQSDADFAKREAERKKNPGKQLGKTLSDLEKRYPKEGWTHDSLADQLFEHERTYEEQLAGKLKKQLNK